MSSHNMYPYNDAPQEEPLSEEAKAAETAPPEAEEQSGQPEAAPDPAEQAKAEIEDMRLRMAAEMDNFKKRLNREHQEQMRYASEKVLSALLPALDNLDLALQYGASHEACREMMQGIELTRKQLLDAVGQSGLIALGEKGEEFNPAHHEAIGMEADDSVPPGGISRVLQRGYKLHDRLLRPAKVMVNQS